MNLNIKNLAGLDDKLNEDRYIVYDLENTGDSLIGIMYISNADTLIFPLKVLLFH